MIFVIKVYGSHIFSNKRCDHGGETNMNKIFALDTGSRKKKKEEKNKKVFHCFAKGSSK